jgi:CBS domain-containing protein
MKMTAEARALLETQHPYDRMDAGRLDAIAAASSWVEVKAGAPAVTAGDTLPGLFVIRSGEVRVTDENGTLVSELGPGNSFGERGLMRGGKAVTTAEAMTDTRLLLIPEAIFHELFAAEPSFRRFFDRSGEARGASRARPADLTTIRVADLMAHSPVTCTPRTPLVDAARLMRDRRISCLCVTEDERLVGIVTVRDFTNRGVAAALPVDTPVAEIMTAHPITLPSSAIGSDVLHTMMERHLGHLPIVDGAKLVGIVTQTDLTRFQATTSARLVSDVAGAATPEELARSTAEIPRLLMQLVAAGNRHEVVTRLITDISDAVTRRLLKLAEDDLGPPPVPYLWLACGSQGRQEQTGVSDQDNCFILDDAVTEADLPYFERLARRVSDGLDAAGYVYCPGDMMATNARWRQPVRVWRDYFRGWIATPSTEAQMLASVMFDLRPIGGERSLFDNLQAETLELASRNSIFTAHMAANSLKHHPPLGLLRNIATIRSGEHRNTLDLKMNGVVPIVDLGRMYALRGRLTEVNTRARLEAAGAAGIISKTGARDLLDAYDLIAETRLEHQARRVKSGERPDNYLVPAELSDFERSHLRDAFVVVKTMQSALVSGRGGVPG